MHLFSFSPFLDNASSSRDLCYILIRTFQLAFSLVFFISLFLGNLSQEWTRKDEKPPFFDIYLSAAVALFYHPSMILKYESLEVFVMLKNNAILTDDPTFNEAIEKILTHMPDAMQRVRYFLLVFC